MRHFEPRPTKARQSLFSQSVRQTSHTSHLRIDTEWSAIGRTVPNAITTPNPPTSIAQRNLAGNDLLATASGLAVEVQ